MRQKYFSCWIFVVFDDYRKFFYNEISQIAVYIAVEVNWHLYLRSFLFNNLSITCNFSTHSVSMIFLLSSNRHLVCSAGLRAMLKSWVDCGCGEWWTLPAVCGQEMVRSITWPSWREGRKEIAHPTLRCVHGVRRKGIILQRFERDATVLKNGRKFDIS